MSERSKPNLPHRFKNEASRLDETSSAGATQSSNKWLRRGMYVVATLVILVLLAPTLVTRTPIKNYLLRQSIPTDAGKLTVESISLGWLRPLSIQGVKWVDADDQSLLSVQEIQGNRSLWSLINNTADMGELTVTKPILHLSLRPDGSNVEDLVAKLTPSADGTEAAAPEPDAQFSPIAAKIQIVDAEIVAVEQATNASWKLQHCNGEAQLPNTLEEDWLVKLQGDLDGQPFAVDFATPMGQATEAWPLGPTGVASVKANALPLAPLRYAATRSGQQVEDLRGALTTDFSAQWQPQSTGTIPKLIARGLLRAERLRFASVSILGDDVLEMEAAQLSTEMEIANNLATIHEGELTSDYGSASLVSAFDLDALQDPEALVELLQRQQVSTSGDIDLAALTRALPQTFKIRDDVQIASGRIAWSVQSVAESESITKWTGQLQTADVQVRRNGQPIDWQFPLEVDFAAVGGDQVQLERLTARSDFFSLAGQGRLQGGTIQARADLERLVYQLSQVMDLNSIYVRGQMQSVIQWSELQPNQLKLDGRTKLLNFVMTQNEQLLCQEKELNAITQATATLEGQSLASLDTGRLDILSGQDFLVVQLQQPITNPSANSNLPLACRLKGDLSSWFGRLKTVGVDLGWQVAGQVDVTTHVTANQQQAEVHDFSVDVRNLQASTEGLVVNEPLLQVNSSGSVDLLNLAGRFPETNITSQTVALAARDVLFNTQPTFVISGDVGYRADLQRLLALVPSDASGQLISGGAAGRISLEAKGPTTVFKVDGNIENLQVVESDGNRLWQEPKLTTNFSGHYDASQDALQLSNAKVVGRVLNFETSGFVKDLSGNISVDVAGEYGYDLAGLVALFRDMIGPDVQLEGSQRQQFALRGPLFPVPPESGFVANELSGNLGLGWDKGNVYGVPLGNGQINAGLERGVLQMSPLEIPVGEGVVRLAPTMHLNTDLMWMTLPAGTVVESVRLDPQMTSGWMKYVAPMMADAASTEGTFSVSLQQADVPLMDPMQARVQGTFVIHGGALGPGPMAGQLLELATQVKRLSGKGDSRIANPSKSWVKLQPQNINFQMVDNRVYHENFQMVIDDVVIRTRGSVGVLDQSLALMAEVPILDEWVDRTPHLAGLRGQVVSVPIGGTTSRPELDQRALGQATMQLARQAGAGYLQGQLSDKLGGKLQDALGGNLADLLGGRKTAPQNSDASQATGATAPQGPPQDLGTQLQNKAEAEISKQLNKLFK